MDKAVKAETAQNVATHYVNPDDERAIKGVKDDETAQAMYMN